MLHARLLLALSLVGCGGQVAEHEVDGGAEVGALAACTQPCAERGERRAAEGLCEPMLVGGDAGFVGCEAYCASQSPSWSADQRAAFERCARTDPLCYQTIEQCMAR